MKTLSWQPVNLTSRMVTEFEWAVSAWHKATGINFVRDDHRALIQARIGRVNGFDHGRVAECKEQCITFDERVGWEVSWVDRWFGVLGRDASYPFRYVALHELGHALGLGHSSDRHSVMTPVTRMFDPVTRIDRDSAIEARRRWR